MVPPFVNDMLGCLRRETVLPVSARIDEASDDAGSAYALPVAAAIIGGLAAVCLLLCWGLRLPSLPAAAVTLAALAAITGARMEGALVRGGDKLAGVPGAGAAALILLLIVEAASLDGLIALHPTRAAFALIAAVVLGQTTALAFRLTQPGTPIEEIGDAIRRSHGAALQGLTIVAIVIAAALILPVYGLGATAAAFTAALAAFVAVIAIAKNQIAAEVPDFSGAAGKTVETATLLAILAFIRNP